MEGTGMYTFNGLTLIYYTDTKYDVGDTIRICNKCEEKPLEVIYCTRESEEQDYNVD